MINLQTSFSAGELSPAFHGRADAAGFASGLALCRNFFILAEGGAANRAGTRFCAPAKYGDKPCRLIPFSLPSGGWAVIEAGEGYMRFFVDGAPLTGEALTIADISRSAPAVAVCAASGLVSGMHVFLETAPGMERLEGRYLRVGEVDGWSFSLPEVDSSRLGNLTAPGSARPVYEIESPYDAEEVFALSFAQSGETLYLAHPDHPPRKLSFTASTATFDLAVIDFTPRPAPPDEVTATPAVRESGLYRYGVSALVGGFTGREESFAREVEIGDGPETLSAAKPITVGWSFEEIPCDLAGFKVYRAVDGIMRLVRECGPGETSVKDDGSEQTAEGSRDPLYDTAQFAAPGRYPAAVGLFEQRLWWGGTREAPLRLWASRTGDFENMAARNPLQADDPLTFQLAANRVNPIRHLVSLKNLLILTSGAEFALVGGEAGVTATSARLVAEGYRGSSEVAPLAVGDRLLFVEERGSTVRQLFKGQASEGWFGGDLSFTARHLFAGRRVVSWCHASHPHGVVWAVLDDGGLLSLTFLPEYGVNAWARHDTAGGAFESACSVGGAAGDEVWFTVARTFEGRTERFVERLAERVAEAPEEGFFVDCGVTARGEGLTVVKGLDHLEGRTVALTADGRPLPPRAVVAGAVMLDRPASVVHAGLPITADLATLPLPLDPAGAARRKRVGRVSLRLMGVGGILAGPSFEELTELKAPVPGTPENLGSREEELTVGGGWGNEAQVCVRQALPLAITVQSVAPEVSLGV